ncbi:MAG: DUF4365 domain-containing protein [Cyanothece sp. SIO2G6]|nr:DUF4365 domain-containing protein [Cyanothece sp. SIO2G6]
MLPQQQIEEFLSWSHIRAVAGYAGVSISIPDWDSGVDGTFRRLAVRGARRFPCGYALDFQLKASKNCQIEPEHIVYDLAVKTYNDLIIRRNSLQTIGCLLILKCLPHNSTQWIESNEYGLLLAGGCYWEYLQEEVSTNKESVRIRIARSQQFTPTALRNPLDQLETGTWR